MPEAPNSSGRVPVRETLDRIAIRLATHPADLPPALRREVAEAWRGRLTDVLEIRVGERLATGIPDERLAEFERHVDSGDDASAAAWLDEHIPDHRRIVDGVLEQLIEDVVDWFAALHSAQGQAIAR